MNRILVILTIDTENLPGNFQEIIKHEREVVAQWKKEGFLDQLFLRQTKNGAVLIFKEINEEKVNQLMTTLPLYKLKKSMEVFLAIWKIHGLKSLFWSNFLIFFQTLIKTSCVISSASAAFPTFLYEKL